MRVVIDTNVLLSALFTAQPPAAKVLDAWQDGRLELVSSTLQLEELNRVTRYPAIRARLTPALAGRLVNEIRTLAVVIDKLPTLDVSRDPYDNYLLAMAQASGAQYLVSGDKRDVLALKRFGATKIVSLRAFLSVLEA